MRHSWRSLPRSCYTPDATSVRPHDRVGPALTLWKRTCKNERREGQMLKSKLLVGLFLFAGSMFSQVSFGISIGAPPPPRVMRVRPMAPGPDYIWVDGYWYPERGRYHWHQGYWTRRPYEGAR